MKNFPARWTNTGTACLSNSKSAIPFTVGLCTPEAVRIPSRSAPSPLKSQSLSVSIRPTRACSANSAGRSMVVSSISSSVTTTMQDSLASFCVISPNVGLLTGLTAPSPTKAQVERATKLGMVRVSPSMPQGKRRACAIRSSLVPSKSNTSGKKPVGTK